MTSGDAQKVGVCEEIALDPKEWAILKRWRAMTDEQRRAVMALVAEIELAR